MLRFSLGTVRADGTHCRVSIHQMLRFSRSGLRAGRTRWRSFNTLDVKVQPGYLHSFHFPYPCFNTLDVKVQLICAFEDYSFEGGFNTLDVKVQPGRRIEQQRVHHVSIHQMLRFSSARTRAHSLDSDRFNTLDVVNVNQNLGHLPE